MTFESETVTAAVVTGGPARKRRGQNRVVRFALGIGAFIVTIALTFVGLLAITFFIGRTL